MAQIVWTGPALQGLEDTADFLSLEDAPAARDLVRRAFGEVERLGDLKPNPGRYGAAQVSPVEILYRFDGGNLLVIGVSRQIKPRPEAKGA